MYATSFRHHHQCLFGVEGLPEKSRKIEEPTIVGWLGWAGQGLVFWSSSPFDWWASEWKKESISFSSGAAFAASATQKLVSGQFTAYGHNNGQNNGAPESKIGFPSFDEHGARSNARKGARYALKHEHIFDFNIFREEGQKGPRVGMGERSKGVSFSGESELQWQ